MTPDTKTLLTLAAKAAGIDAMYFSEIDAFVSNGTPNNEWTPDTDDGDSARLRTTLDVNVEFDGSGVIVRTVDEEWAELYDNHNGNKNAALRWATLKLAAEIRRRMKDD